MRTISDMLGDDMEEAWTNVLSAVRNGGVGDKGQDLLTEDGPVQVKSSAYHAEVFLKERMDYHRKTGRQMKFIALVIGEPCGSPAVIKECLRKYGFWLSPDEDNWTNSVRRIAVRMHAVKGMCYDA